MFLNFVVMLFSLFVVVNRQSKRLFPSYYFALASDVTEGSGAISSFL